MFLTQNKGILMLFKSLSLIAALGFAHYSFASSGMQSCLSSASKVGPRDYAVSFSKPARTRLVSISKIAAGKSVLMGQLTSHEMDRINPSLRQLAAGGLVLGYIGVGVATGGAASFVYGLSGLAGASLAPVSVGIIGVGSASVAAAQFADSANPLSQLERANVEKCLKAAGSNLERGESIMIKLKNRDDYNDTVRQIADLIHDLKKP